MISTGGRYKPIYPALKKERNAHETQKPKASAAAADRSLCGCHASVAPADNRVSKGKRSTEDHYNLSDGNAAKVPGLSYECKGHGRLDVYDGKRYQPVTDDDMYAEPISGYIERQ